MNNDIYSFASELFNNKKLQNIIHFIPMYKFICDDEDNIIIDKVIHYENMNNDIDNILNKYNINTKFIITNKSEHKNYLEIVKPHLINIINYLYDKDFKIFNYEKII